MAETFDLYADAGIRILPLAGFAGRIPTVAEAQNLAGWAKAYGPGGTFWANRTDGHLAIRQIEFGNETQGGYQYGDNEWAPSYTERAKAYALRFKDAYDAIAAGGVKVGLLAQSDDWTGMWLGGNYAAVPDFHRYVDGFTMHPYGNTAMNKVRDNLKQMAIYGVPTSIPIDITEWGLATTGGTCLTDNYGLDKCMTFDTAAVAMRDTVKEFRTLLGSRLRSFMLYQVRDQRMPGVTIEREHYFGALTYDAGEKGAFTSEFRSLLGSGS
ncbi:MAG: hypothetical protein AVDCRST_MAG30-1442 [uncultured Solirubrobacteraceae bacterium]|uniref:Asl1-like glycosyl hydrolase catalytic domain-containing protein n=1 Tax=uncultured Solirubrobacteraceae bacterium TaxID=1162706 RepID=A0A6J4S896_9ACTN|nr:MAG: hypothetical protein AVDCRST_MAG30-1442 [uncultured Solirubrobacteraceae bacterium]